MATDCGDRRAAGCSNLVGVHRREQLHVDDFGAVRVDLSETIECRIQCDPVQRMVSRSEAAANAISSGKISSATKETIMSLADAGGPG